MNDLRIQIVNYKTKQPLLRCLASVIADIGDDLHYTIAILDNASGDDISDIPSLFPGVPFELMVNENNSGFGAGQNLLAKGGDAQRLLILNPDVQFIEPRTVQRMLDRLAESSSQVIGPRLVTPEGKTQHWDHGESEGLYAHIALAAGRSHWKVRSKPAKVAWVSGAALMIEKEWFDRLEGFDEQFFLYKEEEDLCLRLREQGGVVLYDPTVSVFHEGSVVAKKKDHFQKSQKYFFKKHILKRKNRI